MKEFNTQFDISARNIIVRFDIGNIEFIGKFSVNSFIDYIDFYVI